MKYFLVILCVLLWSCLALGWGEQCGWQAWGNVCPDRRCCSSHGWCGSTYEYCGEGCQSQCGSSDEPRVSDIVSEHTFDKMLPLLGSFDCPSSRFYAYDSFIEAASNFSGFGTTGDLDTRKREIAAFFGHTSFETASVDFRHARDPYSSGYCYVSDPCAEKGDMDYCDTNDDKYPCAPDERYYGRGPFQLKGNHNYGAFEDYSGIHVLDHPGLLSRDAVTSFSSAFWYWMTPPQSQLPSSHDIMIQKWQPTSDDFGSGREPGFGLTTNVLVGKHECGHGWNANERDRIEFYKRLCDILKVDPGDNLSCEFQQPFPTNSPKDNHVQTV